jgi:hypothetical protein
MIGRAEVARLRQQLDATFVRLKASKVDPEIQSDHARYLCVLVSGFLEQAVIELLQEYVRKTSAPAVQRHVERRLSRFANANAKRLIEMMGSFDSDWQSQLETFLVDEYKDAVDSIVSLRNSIAHGRHVGLTLHRVVDYYEKIKDVVNYIDGICAP